MTRGLLFSFFFVLSKGNIEPFWEATFKKKAKNTNGNIKTLPVDVARFANSLR